MKRIGSRIGFVLALGLVAIGASNVAEAHSRVVVGVGVGAPVGWGWGYPPPPYYYYPPAPVVVVPQAPVEYVEAEPAVPPAPAASAAPGPSNMWYYCQKPQGYYPYVKQCPGGWQSVTPHPQ
jgi:hypothetical protein